jgi:hypothetical protein
MDSYYSEFDNPKSEIFTSVVVSGFWQYIFPRISNSIFTTVPTWYITVEEGGDGGGEED